MRKFYKLLFTVTLCTGLSQITFAQQRYWSSRADVNGIATDKSVARTSYPKEFKLFDLNAEPLRQQLFSIVGDQARSRSTIISLPNADGQLEQFEVFEASNFEPELQARFPEIRAYSGKGLTDRFATLKLSISPQGIQTMVFRAGNVNEFIEPYSQDHTVYSVFRSSREKGSLPWTCSTQEKVMFSGINSNIAGRIESSAGELKTMRLAQSCNGEYANWFGATSSAQVALVLAAYNATLTRCNGVYEKDLALHLNLVPETVNVIYYNPATDPYTSLPNWNTQLQIALNTTLTGPGTPLAANNAAYDIGHMFGASGGGGNAGCIGCVCVDGVASGTGATKGRGITSPADGIPMGDNFDIDYVAHEVGHQLGANHTFSMSNEGTGVNKEVGSGITIMGYAGITGQDVAPHSIDIFHEASIEQIQVNLAGKSCPITTSLTGINATPVVNAGSDYTIPISTPFALMGSATDADAGDVLTYCWEQDDNGTGATTGSNSVASPTKTIGPNWLSFKDNTSPVRLMPRLSTILAGNSVTGPLPGGDPGANIEALSSVARTLNFRLTVRDNRPYNSGTSEVGQTNFDNTVITVNAATGPFLITSQNSPVSYDASSSQTVTWSVNGTTGAPINCANVKISFSTDGGNTFPIVLAASTPNDGSEAFTVPAILTTLGRIKVEAIGNIFFDINNANITITPPPFGFSFGSTSPATAPCPAPASMNVTLPTISNGGFTNPITLSATAGVPAGTSVSFGTNPVTPGNSSVVTLNNTNTLAAGTYTVTITGTASGAPNQTADLTFTINAGSGPAITTQPANQIVCEGDNASFSVVSTGTYQWQLSTDGGSNWGNVSGATSSTLNLTAVTTASNGYQYRCIVTGQCGSTTSDAATLTVNVPPAITADPAGLSLCAGSGAMFSVSATGSGLMYQWQVSTDGGSNYSDIPGETASTYSIAATTTGENGNLYRCVVTGSCPPAATSAAALLSVSSDITITGNPTDKTVCEGTNTSFVAAASGTGLSYQWQVSTNGGGSWADVSNGGVYSGATTNTLSLTGVMPSMNTYQYRCVVSNPPCNPGTTTAAMLTVNTFPQITAQPQSATICESQGNTFSVSATTGIGLLTYQWQVSTNGGSSWINITGATSSSYAVSLATAGANGYQYRVMVTAGCGTVTSNAATLTVNTYPVITLGSIPTVICVSDASVTLSGSPAGGTFSGAGVSGNTFSPSAAGVGAATITYTATNAGCVSTQNRVIQVNECPERHLRLDQYPAIVLYPNPTSGEFRVKLNTDLYTQIGIQIYDSQGRIVQQKAFSGVGYGSIVNMDMTILSAGIYHVMVYSTQNGFSNKTFKVVLEK